MQNWKQRADSRGQLRGLELADLAHGECEGDFGILSQEAQERLDFIFRRHCNALDS